MNICSANNNGLTADVTFHLHQFKVFYMPQWQSCRGMYKDLFQMIHYFLGAQGRFVLLLKFLKCEINL